MAKLYPPLIEGTIPAFKGNELIVPFSMNRAVGKNNIAGFSLKIKTVQNSLFIMELTTDRFDLNELKAYFTLSDEQVKKLKIGNFYKTQMAYIATDKEIGYYSTVGIVKYTSKPKVYIEGLKDIGTNSHDHSYLGVYEQDLENGDLTEKVHTSQFIITNPDNSIYYDSGEILHNATEDVKVNQSTEYLEILDDLPEKRSFYIQYIIRTNNGLEATSRQYKVMQRKTLDTDFVGEVHAKLDKENGCVDIRMSCDVKELGYIPVVTGAFLISRANVNDLTKWEPLHRFILQSESPNRFIMKDCTIEHGETYIYSLQQYNDRGLYSHRMLTEEVYADFDDLFLYDGERQLCVQFNPKVSSFKNTQLETKIDTIGSRHPFIFRNGKVSYKEFPISGLISHYMDEANLFMVNNELNFSKNVYRKETQAKFNSQKTKLRTTNLTSDNIYLEKQFKLEVLEWLTNGETKLFRSPTEGNYLVRLMNVSLAPNETLGRMLHTFNCNAYEVAENTHNNRLAYGVMTLDNPKDDRTRWATKNLMTNNDQGKLVPWTGEVLEHFIISGQRYIAKSVSVINMYPGDCFYINVPAGEEPEKHPECKIVIPPTGSYNIEGVGDITSIIFLPAEEGIPYRGSITFSFINSAENKFSLVSDIVAEDVALKQIIGSVENVMNLITDVKTDVYDFDFIKICKRPIYNIYLGKDNKYYWNKFEDELQDEVNKDYLDSLGIYCVRAQAHSIEDNAAGDTHFNEGLYISKENYEDLFPIIQYLDGRDFNEIENYSTIAILNDGVNEVELNLESGKPFEGTDIHIESLKLSSGVYLEASYIKYVKAYYLEEEDARVIDAWDAYEQAREDYQLAVKNSGDAYIDEKTDEVIEGTFASKLQGAYKNLLDILAIAIEEYQIEHGLIEDVR